VFSQHKLHLNNGLDLKMIQPVPFIINLFYITSHTQSHVNRSITSTDHHRASTVKNIEQKHSTCNLWMRTQRCKTSHIKITNKKCEMRYKKSDEITLKSILKNSEFLKLGSYLHKISLYYLLLPLYDKSCQDEISFIGRSWNIFCWMLLMIEDWRWSISSQNLWPIDSIDLLMSGCLWLFI
jgi:hypothetical protein